MQIFIPFSIINVPQFINDFSMRGSDQKVMLEDQSGLLISTAVDGSCIRSSTPTEFDYVDSERHQTEILVQEPFLSPPLSPAKESGIDSANGSIDSVDCSSDSLSDPSSDYLTNFYPETNPFEQPVTTHTTPSGLVMNIVFNRGTVNTPQPVKYRKVELEDGSFEVEVDLRENKVVSGKVREFSSKERELQTSLVNEMKKKFSEKM